jgi:hypothetical protein
MLGWAVPALLMRVRGFAVLVEGTYVLSYRYWASNPYFVSGSQYFYGPIFEALGESIPLLRLLRLVMVIGANAWFAVCFLAWLDRCQPGALPGSRASLALLMIAAGGMSYLWAPLTPGYYDLTADASLALVSLLFLTLVRTPRPPAWIPVVMGIVGVILIVTKWTAFTVLVLTVGVAAFSVAGVARRAVLRFGVLFLAGLLAALLSCQLFLVPVVRFATIMSKLSSLSAVGSHGLVYIARENLQSTGLLLFGALVFGLPLLVALVVAKNLVLRHRNDAARRWLFGAGAFTSVILPFAVGWHGGSERGRVLVGIALAGLIVAGLAGVLSRPGSLPGAVHGRLVAVVLFLVPLAQAAGTNVPLLYVAAECVAMWVALVVMPVARAYSPRVVTTAVTVNLAVLVVATAMIAGSTTLQDPFKTTGLSEDTALVPALGVRVSTATAGQFAALRRALDPYVVPGVTPMITLDQKAGLTYLLDAVPAGSTWTDAVNPTWTAGILELACDNGDVADATPVLLLDRKVDRSLAQAMQHCGFDYPGDFRRLAVPGGPPDLTVYVPRRSG